MELPYDPAAPILGIYPDKTMIEKTHVPYVHSSTIQNSQDMETVSTDEWIKKMWHIYMQWNITQPEKERSNAICSHMDGPRDDHTK